MRRGKVMRATEMRGTAPAMTAASAAPSVAASASAATGSSAAATAALAEGERALTLAASPSTINLVASFLLTGQPTLLPTNAAMTFPSPKSSLRAQQTRL